MQSSLENLAPSYGSLLMWAILIVVGLLALWLIMKLLRGRTFGTFIAGGKNRKMRLAIMDATPVDNHRRLVLVRRDDVEHLILIGGPNDIVIEQNIRPQAQHSRPGRDAEMQRRAEPAIAIPASRPAVSQPRAVEPAHAPKQTEAPNPATAQQQRADVSISAAQTSAPEVRIEPSAKSSHPVSNAAPTLSAHSGPDKIDDEMDKFLDDLAQLDQNKRS